MSEVYNIKIMRNYNIIVLWFIFFFVVSEHAIGQSFDKLTVDESVAMGLQHSFQLRAARADTEEAAAAHQRARADRRPALQGEASYTRLSGNIPSVDFTVPGMDTTFTLLPVELNRFYSELSLHQPIYNGGRRNKQIEAASHMADAAKLMEAQAQSDIAFEIRQAYWNLYRATEEEKAVEIALAMVEEHLQEVRNRFEEGVLLKTDLLRAEVRHSEVLLEEVEARSNVRMARLNFNRLTGLPRDAKPLLVEPAEKAPERYVKADLVEHALMEKPSLHAHTKQVLAQEAELGIFKNEGIPEINLVGRYIYARPNQYFFAEQDHFRRTWEAGVAMRWNIWSGGRRQSEVNQAEARLQSAEANLADLEERIIMEVERDYLELERSEAAMVAAAANLEVSEAAFQMARHQFGEGVVLSSQVLDTEYSYRLAKARYVGAVSDYEIAKAAILNALGQIWDDGY